MTPSTPFFEALAVAFKKALPRSALPGEFAEALLREEDVFGDNEEIPPVPARPNERFEGVGVLVRPFYRELASVLDRTVEAGQFRALPLPDGIDPVDSVDDLNAQASRLLLARAQWGQMSEDEQIDTAVETLDALGVAGILRALNVRRTRKSVADKLPPSRAQLWHAFNVRADPKVPLSVGARALAKHHHRASDQFWGSGIKGNDRAKNEVARAKLLEFLDGCVWMNSHLLPRSVPVYEIRLDIGYGARWDQDGSTFRGYLEPQIERGWEVGWKH